MEPRRGLSSSPSRPDVASATGVQWVHYCERCGEQMEERQCKIVCKNCGAYRDCSDPWRRGVPIRDRRPYGRLAL